MPSTLHATWIAASPGESACLFLWAESPPAGRQEPRRPERSSRAPARKLRNRGSRVPVHPGLVAPAVLRHRLRSLLVDIAQGDLPLAKRAAHLPVPDNGVRSHNLHVSSMQEFRVLGLDLAIGPALRVLNGLLSFATGSSSGGPDTEQAGAALNRYFVPGSDLRYWGQAAEYALALVRAGRAVPFLQAVQGGWQVQWSPWQYGREADLGFQEFARCMPGVNLSFADNVAGDRDAASLLTSFVNAVVHERMAAAAAAVGSDDRFRQVSDAPRSGSVEVQDQWCRLLVNGVVEAEPEQRRQMQGEWQEWISRAFGSQSGDIALAFELLDPQAAGQADGDGPWQLQVALAADDMLGSHAWHDRLTEGRKGIAADRLNGGIGFHGDHRAHATGADPDPLMGARLIAGLRAASRHSSCVQPLVRQPGLQAIELSREEAYRFLTKDAPALMGAGFQVHLPVWWTDAERSRLQIHLDVREVDEEHEASAQAAFGEYEIGYALTVDGDPLDDIGLSQIAMAGSPLVYMNEQWLQVNQGQIRAARHLLATRGASRRVGLLQALQIMQEQADDEHGETRNTSRYARFGSGYREFQALEVSGVTVPDRLRTIWQRIRSVARDEERFEPPGFVGTLRPYQRRGLAWLWYLHQIGLGACLADDMGLGKTIQAIALFLEQERTPSPEGRRPRLLICPTSVLRNWKRELQRFAPGLRVMLHHGGGRARQADLYARVRETDVVLTSYGTARVDQAVLGRIHWHTVMLDEAQNIKNPSAKQTMAVRSLRCRHRFALTGTPIENRLLEVWSILDFLNGAFLGSQQDFKRRFIQPIEGESNGEKLGQLQRIVQPFVLRRLKSDPEVISDLPEKQEIDVICDLSSEQTDQYARAVEASLPHIRELDGMRRRGSILALMTQLRKIANHPALLDEDETLSDNPEYGGRSGKLDRFTEMLTESLDGRNKVLVFTTFVRMGQILQAHIAQRLGFTPEFISGRVPHGTRQQMVDRFQEGGQACPVLVLSVRTGGVGINLTAANQVYHFDRWWNPAVEDQATDRAHRIGQTRRVQVFRYIMAGTVEEHVDRLIRQKGQLARDILGAGTEWLTELSNDQLYELLTLRHPDVPRALP
ncbi:MAG: DEAD/DEAH box helicase [Caldilineaceae bacterium]|nr:DEAD/DEAH box helicase [Caldilineaceae bacterium]